MNNASLELGGTNWAEKDGNLLGYAVGDTSGRYVPREFDFSRGSNLAATRVDENGLIEKGRENLLLQSNQFDTNWTNTSSTETGGQAGYDGTNDAWLINTTAFAGRLSQTFNSISGVHRVSVYAKAASSSWLFILANASSNGDVYFDLGNGVVGNVGSAAFDAQIESVGNGWYRCSFAGNYSSLFEVRIYPAEENTISGPGGSIFIQDAQVEVGLAATEYIESTTTTAQAGILENTPRLDYSGGATEPSLLLEPSRTNIFAYSEGMFDSSYFSQILAISVEGQQTDLNGTNTAVKLSNFVQSSSRLDYTTTIVAVNGKTYTYSAYYKGSGSININVSSSTGVGGAEEKTITLTDEWVRHSVTTTFSSPTGNVKSHLVITRTPNNDAEVYLCFAQIEEGSHPTSYIPTYGTSVTRSGEVCGNAGNSSTFNSTEGVLYAEIAALADSTSQRWISIGSGSNANRVSILFNATSKIGCSVRGSSAAIYDASANIGSQTNNTKAAIKYKNSDFSFFVNGLKVDSQQSGSISFNAPLSELAFDSADGGSDFYGNVKQLLTFNTALTDQELSDLTNPYKSYSEFVTGEGFTWESQDCTNNSIAVLKSLS